MLFSGFVVVLVIGELTTIFKQPVDDECAIRRHHLIAIERNLVHTAKATFLNGVVIVDQRIQQNVDVTWNLNVHCKLKVHERDLLFIPPRVATPG